MIVNALSPTPPSLDYSQPQPPPEVSPFMDADGRPNLLIKTPQCVIEALKPTYPPKQITEPLHSTKRLVVHGISPAHTRENVADIFSSFGTIERIDIQPTQGENEIPGQVKAYVSFATTDEAQAALQGAERQVTIDGEELALRIEISPVNLENRRRKRLRNKKEQHELEETQVTNITINEISVSEVKEEEPLTEPPAKRMCVREPVKRFPHLPTKPFPYVCPPPKPKPFPMKCYPPEAPSFEKAGTTWVSAPPLEHKPFPGEVRKPIKPFPAVPVKRFPKPGSDLSGKPVVIEKTAAIHRIEAPAQIVVRKPFPKPVGPVIRKPKKPQESKYETPQPLFHKPFPVGREQPYRPGISASNPRYNSALAPNSYQSSATNWQRYNHRQPPMQNLLLNPPKVTPIVQAMPQPPGLEQQNGVYAGWIYQ